MNKDQAKLKAARKEIEAVFKKYDLMGMCSLHGGNNWGEVFWNIWPSWSCLEGDLPSTLRVKSKLSQIPPHLHEKEMHKRAQTAQAIRHIGETMHINGGAFLQVAGVVDALTGAVHTDEGHYPDSPPDAKKGTH
jgi:hypothetical protein